MRGRQERRIGDFIEKVFADLYTITVPGELPLFLRSIIEFEPERRLLLRVAPLTSDLRGCRRNLLSADQRLRRA